MTKSPTFPAQRRFDRDWKKIEAYVGTKTVVQVGWPPRERFPQAATGKMFPWVHRQPLHAPPCDLQIRSHAQKYFLKVQKLGTGEHVPPPRPKRKSLHPYPTKDQGGPAGARQC